MPRIKRWFPVSHDINADTEVWELTDKFGLTGLRAWLEILSIADRNDGELPGQWSLYPSLLAARCKSTTRHLVGVCQFTTRWLVVDSEGTARVANYWKYHRTPEQKPVPSEPDQTEPDLIKKKNKIIHPILEQNGHWPSPMLLIEKYNKETPDSLPAVEKVTPARLRKARDYLKIFADESFWSEAFQEIAKSDFLLGLKGSNGHEAFKANFDWLLTKGKDGTENVVKVFEGRYRNGQTQGFTNGSYQRRH